MPACVGMGKDVCMGRGTERIRWCDDAFPSHMVFIYFLWCQKMLVGVMWVTRAIDYGGLDHIPA